MATKRASRPVQQPADAAGVAKAVRRRNVATATSTRKKAIAKKTVAKKVTIRKTAAKKAVIGKATVGKTATRKVSANAVAAKAAKTTKSTDSRRDGIAARKQTIVRTQRLVDQTPIAVDDSDASAIASIATKASRKRPRAPSQVNVPGGRVRRSAVDRLDDPPPASGGALLDRVSRAIERELTQIEVIVGNHHVPPRQRTEAERRARTLASLARTLREVAHLRAGEKKERHEDDDAVPRDLTQLRLELARRMDQLVAEAKAAHPEPPE